MKKGTNWFGWAGVGVIGLLICAFFSTQVVQLASAACTNTTNLSLCKPALQDSGWGTSLNNNFDLIDAKFPGGSAVPSNVIVFTTDASCPTGFAEYTAARGRFLVGVPASGTNAGTVGSAMTNLQNLTHTHTGPSHTHTYTDVVNHVHSVDPPSTAASISDSGHSHTERFNTTITGASNYINPGTNTATITNSLLTTTSNTTGITASVNIAAFDSANPTGGVATGTTAADGTGATGTASTSTIAPYVQLRLCQKS